MCAKEGARNRIRRWSSWSNVQKLATAFADAASMGRDGEGKMEDKSRDLFGCEFFFGRVVAGVIKAENRTTILPICAGKTAQRRDVAAADSVL